MCNHIYLWSWSNMEWICKWFIRYYSQQQWHTDQFRWYYRRLRVFLFKDVRKHSSLLRIKAKFSLAFIHALILLLGSFLLFSKTFSSMQKEITRRYVWCLLIVPQHYNYDINVGPIIWLPLFPVEQLYSNN